MSAMLRVPVNVQVSRIVQAFKTSPSLSNCLTQGSLRHKVEQRQYLRNSIGQSQSSFLGALCKQICKRPIIYRSLASLCSNCEMTSRRVESKNYIQLFPHQEGCLWRMPARLRLVLFYGPGLCQCPASIQKPLHLQVKAHSQAAMNLMSMHKVRSPSLELAEDLMAISLALRSCKLLHTCKKMFSDV